MRKQRNKVWMIVLLVLTLLTSLSKGVQAAKLPNENWAKEYIEFLFRTDIVSDPTWLYQPDRLITKEEGLALVGRLLKVVYGPLSEGAYTNRTDYRAVYKQEIDQLAGQIDMLVNIEQKKTSKLQPGEKMLYYLHLSAMGQPMKQPLRYNSDWWLSAAHLQQSMTREELSMVLSHVLAPQIDRAANRSTGIEQLYDDLYNWKGNNLYRDTVTLFPSVLKSYKIFQADADFQPKQAVTRGQYAVVLKRLYDLLTGEHQRIAGGVAEQADQINVLLSAASYAYQRGDRQQLTKFFSDKAISQLEKIRPMPFHQYYGELTVGETSASEISLSGFYRSSQMGNYQIDYRLVKPAEQAKAPYGWIIDSFNYIQR
ncbi:hypothetical protein [Brevibacillus fulvus]|uniref:S-layer protein n=1 Tax=Brevibacillus fulvus TaxID=1125967 RepID=A0A939BRU3_9BACL|nr:hypothetical protein [Brevibacillus fulvus]MBM7589803.1 hypothetical protein [Brevibacillus fulvus]